MPKAYTSTIVNAPANEVWAYLRDFNDLPKWTGGIVIESEIEEGLAGDQVGAVRSFKLGDGEHLRERLLSHSDAYRMYSYNFEKTPFDVDDYHALAASGCTSTSAACPVAGDCPCDQFGAPRATRHLLAERLQRRATLVGR